MATSSPYIARTEAIGFGIEATPGTSVAPQIWMRWLTNGLQSRTTVAENESAMGVVDRVNDSEITAKWAEGTIGGKVTDQQIGFLLLGYFGTVSTGAAVSGIYPHTFTTKQSSEPTALTTTLKSLLETKRYPYTVFDNLEITNEAGAYVEVSTAIKARVGATATETVAFISEEEFTSKHISVKTAADVASLGAAPNVQALSVKLTLERSSEPFNPLGTDDTPIYDRLQQDVRGEMVVRLTDTQYETDFLSNTVKAIRISMINGTRELTFTIPQGKYRELEKTRDRDAIVTATIQFSGEMNQATSSAITTVLKNPRTGYVAA